MIILTMTHKLDLLSEHNDFAQCWRIVYDVGPASNLHPILAGYFVLEDKLFEYNLAIAQQLTSV